MTQKDTHKTRVLRLPKELDADIVKRSKEQGRSINSQIVFELGRKK